jgi:hypothetical protein
MNNDTKINQETSTGKPSDIKGKVTGALNEGKQEGEQEILTKCQSH